MPPETWDLFSTAFGVGYIVPSSHLLLSGYFPFEGWYGKDDAMAAIVQRWQSAGSEQQRTALLGEIQAQFYRDQPAIKVTDYSGLSAAAPSVDLSGMSFYQPTWWNVRAK
jgi:peptide/nickel transport system substrate-binding protein